MPGYDGYVEVREADFGEEPVQEVEGERGKKSEDEAEGDPLIGAAPGVHVGGETAPGYGLGVEGLETLVA